MKRFYKTVDILERDGFYYMTLDGNFIKTPHKNDLCTDNLALAGAMKQEWDHVGTKIDVTKMPITKYMNTLLDRTQPQRAQMNALLVEYIHHDALCYFAGAADEEFNALQTQKWLPIIEQFNKKFDLKMQTTSGIMPLMQDKKTSDFASHYTASLSPTEFIAFYQLVTLTGSFILGVLIFSSDIQPQDALDISLLEEDRNSHKWGEDPETAHHRKKKQAEWDEALLLLKLVI